MCSVLPKKGNLLTNVNNYLTCSYYLGYNLDSFFTQNHQIIMFERLLSCDASFKQDWEIGAFSIPEDPSHTMYSSSYIKKQSHIKKLSRRVHSYIYNNKLTKGAKNLLQAYMINYSQDSSKNIDAKMEEMFCGILKQVNDRKDSYLSKLVPSDLTTEIKEYLPQGGGKIKRKTKPKTKKRNTRNKKNITSNAYRRK